MSKLAILRFTPQELARMREAQISKQRSRLEKVIAAAEIIDYGKISMINVTDRCPHGCRHCAVSASPKGNDISISTIEKAIEKSHLPDASKGYSIDLTGGEPLIHPQIREIIRLTNGRIPFTNGFEKGSIEEFRRQLEEFGDRIDGVSFQTFDRWRGNNPGRDAVIAYKLTQTSVYLVKQATNFQIMTLPGQEKQTIRAWVQTILRVAEQVSDKAALVENLQYLPYFGKEHNLGYPSRVGRAAKLKDSFQMGTFSGINFRSKNLALELGSILLGVDGALYSEFLSCQQWTNVKVGLIKDSREQIVDNLRRAVLEFFRSRSNRNDGEWDVEFDEKLARHDAVIKQKIALFELVREEPELVRQVEELIRNAGGSLTSELSIASRQNKATILENLEGMASMFYMGMTL